MSSGRKQPEETPLVTSKRLQVENLSNYQLQLFDLTKRGPEVTRKPFESASQGHLSLANQDLVSITDQQREISGQLLDRSPAQLVVGVLLNKTTLNGKYWAFKDDGREDIFAARRAAESLV